ncbi:hypothetical protein [Acinetobacter nectaris]|uniref:hypothetical protein n=1 Tax=Acinetobacter nectaris TaxID=1219382 RepID=UPI001F2FA4D5|nr:hypothetical protein [Acinetobacter nectaris]MCF9034216.1 hypothetical protein [Acinetobacter nectaris]
MDEKEYKNLTGKKIHKPKPRTKSLPKATEKFLEADELLTEQLLEHGIGFERKYQINSTKHCRFDFHIVKKRLLIEFEGSPWSGGRGGKLASKAWNMNRYNEAEGMGYRVKRFSPAAVKADYVITWLLEMFEEDEDGAN